jgi:hypothetical protein
MKERFIAHVCALLGTDMELIGAVSSKLRSVPDAFWTAPASSSGKYHPIFAQGEGGLVRHTLAVIHIARDLAAAYGIKDDKGMAIITVAAAFHDTYKGGVESTPEWKTVTDHPDLAAQQWLDTLESHWLQDNIYDAIINHMSMWGSSAVALSMMTDYQACVSTADYIASRGYLCPVRELGELLYAYGWAEAPRVLLAEGIMTSHHKNRRDTNDKGKLEQPG